VSLFNQFTGVAWGLSMIVMALHFAPKGMLSALFAMQLR
jgi:hypothetical protein